MIRLKLPSLAKFFKTQNMSSRIIEASNVIPFETLFVYLGDEANQEDPTILQIRIAKQEIESTDLELNDKPNPYGYYHIQFTLPINAHIEESGMSEVGRLILLVNRVCHLPGFEFDEVNKVLYYRYTMLIAGNEIDPYILISIVGTILLFVTTFSDYLKNLANGTAHFKDIVEDFKKIQETLQRA